MRTKLAGILVAALTGAATFGAAPTGASAESYPSRTITIVAPFTPGTPADVAARRLGQVMTEVSGQSVVIENRTGAGGTIASDGVAKASPDGYTLLAGTQSTHAINVGLYKSLPYHPTRSFTPISRISSAPNVLVVHPSLGVSTMSELVKLARQRDKEGKPLTFASGGVGTTAHLAAELLKASIGVNMVHVPYRGTSQAMTDTLTGRVDLIFGPIVVVMDHVQAGTVKALAITSTERSPLLPSVPTVAEVGLKDTEMAVWIAVFAPPNLPDETAAALHALVLKALARPSVAAGFAREGGIVESDPSPAAFKAFVDGEIDRWVKVVRASGASMD